MGMHTPEVHHSIRSAATTSAVVSNVVVVEATVPVLDVNIVVFH